MVKEASYWISLREGLVRCRLCPHDCLLKEGQTGICRTRENVGGVLYTNAYGNPCTVAIDPMEKKPLYHFLPGSRVLSLATAGCNLRCQNCQNWTISQKNTEEVKAYELMPEEVVALALKEGIESIAFTYTEPTIYFEYMLDIAKLAKKNGLKTVMISNGFIHPEPLFELCPYLDAANIDLKVFDESTYVRLTGAQLKPVLETLKILKGEYVWLEITNLLVPGFSSVPSFIYDMCNWLILNGFIDVPLHFSRFFPDFKLPHTPPTPTEEVLQACEMAKNAGLRYVYSGNLHSGMDENTNCPSCRKTLIGRSGYHLLCDALLGNRCPHCHTEIPGRFR